ncbi:glycosyltransferase family 2 protein [Microbacterium sp. P01]|uniref:glycosyltransferase family 2 protein n=1 Tax=Microbacterium sp. P01 TaxID=3366261 RepID=UPI00367330A7
MEFSGTAALIVVSYGSAGLVEANVSQLATEWPELQILVVDCFSSVEERERVRDACGRRGWTAILLDDNAGFGGGVNRGAAVARDRGASVLLVLNPDAILPAPDARALVAAAAAQPMGLIAPLIRRPDGSLWTEGTDLYLDNGTMAGVRHRHRHVGRPRMMWVSGACFAVSGSLWDRVGGFDDEYFLYWEDVDLSRKVLEVGGQVSVLSEAVAVHDEGGTHDDRAAGRAKSETFYYYNIRNRLLFARMRLGADDVRRWRRSALAVSWGILLQGGRRQLLTSAAPWRALRKGLRDGRRGETGPAR